MELPDKAFFGDELGQAIADLYEPLNTHPVLTAALADGWELQQNRLDAWTRLRHPDLLPGGAVLVFAPWWRIKGVALFDGDPDPATLAGRLREFAAVTGVSYRVSSQATGLALIDHTRPPRRDVNEPAGRTFRLVRNEEPQLPPFLLDRRDDRFTSIEADNLWWRLWQPASGSTTVRVAAQRDRPALRTRLRPRRLPSRRLARRPRRRRTAAPRRRRRPLERQDQPGRTVARIAVGVDRMGAPDPADTLSARIEGDRVWVTTPTLAQLKLHGITPQIHEAWIWDKSSRYLDLAAKVLAEGRTHPDPLMVKTIKDLYTRTSGKLAERRPWRTTPAPARPTGTSPSSPSPGLRSTCS